MEIVVETFSLDVRSGYAQDGIGCQRRGNYHVLVVYMEKLKNQSTLSIKCMDHSI